MSNRQNLKPLSASSVKLEALERAFSLCSGNARLRINDDLVGFGDGIVFVSSYTRPTRYLSSRKFVAAMDDADLLELNSMPHWDGRNDYQMTFLLLRVVERVFERAGCLHKRITRA